ncbi:hypothetical protein [Denitratisoma oestradiolicum]|uniref:Uncharacterized protein n=1 Tax=Denitratisoma oestradiolicum TaxID=311182 RepID=A0A6S6XN96_9PROT|nr:hypothetical protein [Denitratisoma oestradiolicum]TWO80942.1 hypothetical protein CBW56_07265 [Denitratisoma oestradiolicum]CAB1367286.1 conserved protein of unknown function [Denitratisoma oestradiolicum]
MNDEFVEHQVRRRVGIATLRRLRQRVDADTAQSTTEARWARRLGALFLLLALAFVASLAYLRMRG